MIIDYFCLNINNQLPLVRHGGRLALARLGSVGGLSQPRRDSDDPKNNLLFTIFGGCCLPIPVFVNHFNNKYSIVNNKSNGYPVRQSFFQLCNFS